MAYNIIRPRRGIKSLWQQYKSRVYKQGEMLVESPETGVGSGPVNIKFGDGVTDYEHLPYAVMAPINNLDSSNNAPITSKAVLDSVVDNLLSNSKLPLSANQGRILSGRLGGLTFVVLTEAQYTALATKDANTLYIRPKG